MACADQIDQASKELWSAAGDFSRLQAIAWAADQVLDNRDNTISELELLSRVSYLLQIIAEKAGIASQHYDVSAAKIGRGDAPALA